MSYEFCFQSITPQGDGNYLKPAHVISSSVLRLSIHYPARGRKLAGINTVGQMQEKFSFNPLPRKGTETLRLFLDTRYTSAFQSITPQGDGN